MSNESKIKTIQRTLKQLQLDIQSKEVQADLSGVPELEAAVQVLQTVLLYFSRRNASEQAQLVNPEVFESFSMEMRLRLACVIQDICQ